MLGAHPRARALGHVTRRQAFRGVRPPVPLNRSWHAASLAKRINRERHLRVRARGNRRAVREGTHTFAEQIGRPSDGVRGATGNVRSRLANRARLPPVTRTGGEDAGGRHERGLYGTVRGASAHERPKLTNWRKATSPTASESARTDEPARGSPHEDGHGGRDVFAATGCGAVKHR